MANGDKTHLWIPADRTRTAPVIRSPRGESYRRDDPAAHSLALRDAFNRSLEAFRGKLDQDLAAELIVQITTTPARPVAKERAHLRNLGFEIIKFEPVENIAVGRINQENLRKLSRRLDRYADTVTHVGKGQLGAIDGLAPVGIERKVDELTVAAAADHPIPVLITLYSSVPRETQVVVANRLIANLAGRGKDVAQRLEFANGTIAVQSDLTGAEMREVAEQFMFIRSIEPDGEIVAESAVQADAVPAIVQVDRPTCDMPVVIVDSGVNDRASLLAGLVVRRVVELPAGSLGPHLSHGTFVASRVVYGDSITSVLTRRASPVCPVIDLQVTGIDGVGNRVRHRGSGLGEVLQRVVPILSAQSRVFNISLGLSPTKAGVFSSLAGLLDYLSRAHKVMFVIAAGNIDQPPSAPPQHYLPETSRLLAPGEALLPITVGSIAKVCENGCVAVENEVVGYSRRGPGADGGVKPELAMHGGNAIYTGVGWTTSPRVGAYGLGRSGTHLEYALGTSYSAPLVAQFAARLFDAYPQASPNLVKALLCHFVQECTAPQPGGATEGRDYFGFGEPVIERALHSAQYSCTYIFTGRVNADTLSLHPLSCP